MPSVYREASECEPGTVARGARVAQCRITTATALSPAVHFTTIKPFLHLGPDARFMVRLDEGVDVLCKGSHGVQNKTHLKIVSFVSDC